MQEMKLQSLGQEDSLEWGMTAHSSILAWETPLTEEPGELKPRVTKESDRIKQLNSNNIVPCFSEIIFSFHNNLYLWHAAYLSFMFTFLLLMLNHEFLEGQASLHL